ncbi:hypothetical protein [Alloprevotella tannerae]|uniref:hypothetical protein n=1 Tax=Alloprevotella tannerae TaxID=76122 RepID=UPI00288A29F0|nr:hypothetical protein [Alloprevotella tannerae]
MEDSREKGKCTARNVATSDALKEYTPHSSYERLTKTGRQESKGRNTFTYCNFLPHQDQRCLDPTAIGASDKANS